MVPRTFFDGFHGEEQIEIQREPLNFNRLALTVDFDEERVFLDGPDGKFIEITEMLDVDEWNRLIEMAREQRRDYDGPWEAPVGPGAASDPMPWNGR